MAVVVVKVTMAELVEEIEVVPQMVLIRTWYCVPGYKPVMV